jgi:hypothetical protein
VIILHKNNLAAKHFSEAVLIKTLKEESAVVTEYLGLNN